MNSNGGTARLSACPASVVGRDNADRLEANHRIANSLQLLSSMLSSQGRGMGDPLARQALETAVHRIGAIAGVHRQLYASNADGAVDLSIYFAELVEGLQGSFCGDDGTRRIQLDVAATLVPGDFAAILGILATELVINACKYAYQPGEPGRIDVVLTTSTAGFFQLDVADEGVGREASGRGGDGLGSRLIDLMVRRLGAEGEYVDQIAGTRFVATGPLPGS